MAKHIVYALSDNFYTPDRLESRFSADFPAGTDYRLFNSRDELLDALPKTGAGSHAHTLVTPYASGLGGAFVTRLREAGASDVALIVHGTNLEIVSEQAQGFHALFPEVPCHLAEVDGQGFFATYHVPQQPLTSAPHAPRQRTYVLEDHQTGYNNLLGYHRDCFPDGQLLMFRDAATLLENVRANFDPYDRYVIITDGVIDCATQDAVLALTSFYSVIEGRGGTVAAAYVASGGAEISRQVIRECPASIRARLQVVSDATVKENYDQIFGQFRPEGTVAPLSREEQERLTETYQGLKSSLRSLAFHGVDMPEGTPAHTFTEASGWAVAGLLAYNSADVAANQAKGQPSVLVADKVNDDVLQALAAGYIAGVACQQMVLAGHDSVQIEAFGASALVGLQGDVQLRSEQVPAGTPVTLDPDGRKLWLGVAETFNRLATDKEDRDYYLRMFKNYNYARENYSPVDDLKLNASSWQALDLAREIGQDIGLLRTEHFCLVTPEARDELRQLLRGEGDTAKLLQNFAVRSDAFMGQLWPYRQMDINVRLLDVKPEEFLPPAEAVAIKDTAQFLDLMDNLRRIQMRSYVKQLVTGELDGADYYKPNQPRELGLRLLVFAPRGLPDYEQQRDIFIAERNGVLATSPASATLEQRKEKWREFWDFAPVGAMLETPRALEDYDELQNKARRLCIGTNDLTENILGISRQDAAARVALANSSGQGADPFHVLYPQVVDVLRGAYNQLGSYGRLSLCGMQLANPRSIAALEDMRVELSLSPTPQNLFILPVQILHEAATREAQRVGLRL